LGIDLSSAVLQRFYPQGLGHFVRSWIDDPLAVGAVAPSGKALSRLMTRALYPGARVAELGPGTGTFTRAMLDRGVDESNLVLLERCPRFVALLRSRYPRANVVETDATQVDARLSSLAGSIDFVVSGLPLVLFSNAQKLRLLAQSFDLLTEQGSFFQFTYGGRCPISQRTLRDQGLSAERVGIAALNVPPAFVYRIARA
jgi:phosphatidylethanolamine/phosphatidyl-N-methylethanolamine N-methyltransferase